jgi:hypothetical protein
LFFLLLGVALTAIGTYALAATIGGTEMYFFQQYFSPTIILTSVATFLLHNEYFEHTIIPTIEQAANQTNAPVIDAFSAIDWRADYFRDGVHVNTVGARLVAEEIYKTITSQSSQM